MKKEYDREILEILKESKEPLDVQKLRKAAKIGNWNTCLNHCLDLMTKGEIQGQHTSRGWIFWAKRENDDSEEGK